MFQFPPNPSVGQTFTPLAGVSYRWNGQAWYLIAGPGSFISQNDADLRYVELTDPRPPVNAIINGDFRIWQRGAGPFVSGGSPPNYFADQWAIGGIAGPAVVQAARESGNLPSAAQAGRVFTDALSMLTTTPNPAPAATDIVEFHQIIEGYQWASLAQRPVVLSFWVQTGLPGVYSVSLYNANAPIQYCVQEYTVNAPNTWERKVVTFPASPASGVWNYTNGIGVYLFFPLLAGTNFHAAPGAWGTGAKFASPNQGNMANPVANYVRLTGVDLRPGTEAPAVFESRSFAEELALCQRYFEKSYDMADAPGTLTINGSHIQWFLVAGVVALVPIRFATRKRAAPGMTFYSPNNGATGVWFDSSAGVNRAATLNALGESNITLQVAAAPSATNALIGHWTASAEF